MEEKEQARDRVSEAAELFSRLSAEDQKKILEEIYELIAKLEAAFQSTLPIKKSDTPDKPE